MEENRSNSTNENAADHNVKLMPSVCVVSTTRLQLLMATAPESTTKSSSMHGTVNISDSSSSRDRRRSVRSVSEPSERDIERGFERRGRQRCSQYTSSIWMRVSVCMCASQFGRFEWSCFLCFSRVACASEAKDTYACFAFIYI